jgi:hypothetical protein
MNKRLIAIMIAAGSLVALQAPASAQLGSTSFALPSVQSRAAVSTPWNSTEQWGYYDYEAPNTLQPQSTVVHQGHRRHH